MEVAVALLVASPEGDRVNVVLTLVPEGDDVNPFLIVEIRKL